MDKKKIFILLGVMVLLLFGITSIGSSDSKYSNKEYEVQKQVIDTFDLADDVKGNVIKPLFARDIFDDKITTENEEIRSKVAMAIFSLSKEKEMSEGDFKPIIFLKEDNDRVLIAVKHANNTITLNEFDISYDISKPEERPVKLDKQVKDVKDEEANK